MPCRKKKTQQQKKPPPTLETLPEVVHGLIGHMFPDGDKPDNRRQLAVLSKRMKELHGGTLTKLVTGKATRRVDALVALVREQHRLEHVVVKTPNAIPALSVTLAVPGCLTHVRELSVAMDFGSSNAVPVTTFVDVLRMPGVLQALEVLRFSNQMGMFPILADALASGACPFLRVLDLNCGYFLEEEMEALVAMLEARAQNPACRRLELLDTEEDDFLDHGRSLAARTRLLRALLRTVTELNHFQWDAAYEECFVAMRPRQLKNMSLTSADPPSVEVWESLPGLEELVYQDMDWGGIAYVEPLIAALHRGMAFPSLRHLELGYLELAEVEWGRLLEALPQAQQLVSLTFCGGQGNLGPEAMSQFSDLLARNAFPTLETLILRASQRLKDEGVAALAKGLLAASRTRLTHLNLSYIGMGDGGMTALASVIRAGRLERLDKILLHGNDTVTDEGLFALARAIKAAGPRGMPMLSTFEARDLGPITGAGIGALVLVLIHNCPRLRMVDFLGEKMEAGVKAAVNGMVRGAECGHRLTVMV